ncbi:MAG: Septum formation initiator [Candidatus Parcubacteria bacterium]
MTVLCAVLLAVLLYGLAGEYARGRAIQDEISRLDAQAAALSEKNAALRTTGETTSSDAMLEREARLKLGLQKPGEQVVVVRGTSAQPVTDDERQADASAKWSNPAKWWHFFLK